MYLYNKKTNRVIVSEKPLLGFTEISQALYDKLMATEVAYIDPVTGNFGTVGGQFNATAADDSGHQVIIDSNTGSVLATGDVQIGNLTTKNLSVGGDASFDKTATFNGDVVVESSATFDVNSAKANFENDVNIGGTVTAKSGYFTRVDTTDVFAEDINVNNKVTAGDITTDHIGISAADGFTFETGLRPSVVGVKTGALTEVATQQDLKDVKSGIQEISIAGESAAISVGGDQTNTILTVHAGSRTTTGVAKYGYTNDSLVKNDVYDAFSYIDTNHNVRTALATAVDAGVVKAGGTGTGLLIDPDGTLRVSGEVAPLHFAGIFHTDNREGLTDATGIISNFYIAVDEGSVDFGHGPIAFKPGDWALYQKPTVGGIGVGEGQYINVPMGSLMAVSSVNGKTGAVVLNKGDIGLDQVQNADQTFAGTVSSGTIGRDINGDYHTNNINIDLPPGSTATFNGPTEFSGRVSFMRNN